MGLCGGTTLVSCDGLRRVPLWIIHGTEDQSVSISRSKEVVENMHKFGDTPLLYYDWMQNCDHGVLARIFYLPETYEWLFSHSLDNRTISEPFLLDKDVMKNAYRNWNSAVKVIISDPPPPCPPAAKYSRQPDDSACR